MIVIAELTAVNAHLPLMSVTFTNNPEFNLCTVKRSADRKSTACCVMVHTIWRRNSGGIYQPGRYRAHEARRVSPMKPFFKS
ncbi:TPA: hypothetical protein ACWOS7_004476, partial [Salmonella enterica subsp. enterica]